MIKRDGEWQRIDWQTALEFVANGLKAVKEKYGAQTHRRAGFAAQHARRVLPAAKTGARIGSENVDHRLRQSDFRADDHMQGAPWLGMGIAEISRLKSALVIGSTLRKDHPLSRSVCARR